MKYPPPGSRPECRVVEQNVLHTFPCFPINASCSTRTASSVYLASMTTEILISEVDIISMLMPSRGQHLEHFRGHAGVRAHADADHGHLGDVGVDFDAFGVHCR